MQTKLICSDIDGTLLNMQRELSNKSIAVIKSVSPIPFILISSRMPQAMLHLQSELDLTNLPLIAYNGGLILHKEQVLHSNTICIETSRSLADFCKGTQIHTSLYHGYEWFVPEMDYWANRESNNTKVIPEIQAIETTLSHWDNENKGAHKIMCMGDPDEIDQLASFIRSNFNDQIIGYRSKPTYLEISPKNISKKTAIETLLKLSYPELQLENVMAFGDNYNDIDMLSSVGIGVAVENAIDEVLAVADAITKPNTEDGVALYLDEILKNPS